MSRNRILTAQKARTQQGMALILVLWIVAALAIFASSLGGVVRQEAAVGGVTRQLAQGRALGEAAIYQVLQRMAVKPADFREFSVVPVSLGGAVVEVDIIPWSGLVNINGASSTLLSALLTQVAGLGQGPAEVLAQAIVQARTGDGQRRVLRPAWESPEDLLQVPGMTYAIYSRLRDFVVADVSARSSINPAAAPAQLQPWLERADGVAAFRQTTISSRYSLVAKVPFGGGSGVRLVRQVDVQGGTANRRLPWVIFSASQAWVGRM